MIYENLRIEWPARKIKAMTVRQSSDFIAFLTVYLLRGEKRKKCDCPARSPALI